MTDRWIITVPSGLSSSDETAWHSGRKRAHPAVG